MLYVQILIKHVLCFWEIVSNLHCEACLIVVYFAVFCEAKSPCMHGVCSNTAKKEYSCKCDDLWEGETCAIRKCKCL